MAARPKDPETPKRWQVTYVTPDRQEKTLGTFSSERDAQRVIQSLQVSQVSGRSSRRTRGSVTKNRAGNWQVRYTDPNGTRRAGGTYRRKEDADQALARVLNAIENGTWTVLDQARADGLDPKRITLLQACHAYLDTRVNSQGRQLSPNTAKEYPRLLAKVAPDLADRPLRAITQADIERWWSRASKETPAQASKTYSHVKTVMTYALKRKWIRENPCDIQGAGNYRPAIPGDIPTESQVQLMLDLADEPMRTIVALGAYCALRKGEILELRRKDFQSRETPDGETWWYISVSRGVVWDGENNPIVGPPKTRSSIRTVAIPKQGGAEAIVLERLRQIPAHPDTLLVSRDKEGAVHWGESMLNPRWWKLRALAGYQGRFHLLRNYGLTWYGQKGATDKEIMDRGGHSTLRVSLGYQRSTDRETSLLDR